MIERFVTICGTVSINIEVQCSACNEIIEWRDRQIGSDNILLVEPCANCKEEKKLKLETKISSLPIKRRTKNTLIHENINTIGDLANRTESDLLRCNMIGRITLKDIKSALANYGLSLKQE